MRSWLILLCITAQTSALAYMIFGRESVIADGQRIYIATAPIDPRDPFRGDFVRLRYPMNSLLSAPNRWLPDDTIPAKGDKVYAVLKPLPDGLHELDYFTNQPPTDALFIRGRRAGGRFIGRIDSLDINFGVEQLYVQQDSGKIIENKRGIRGGMQTAMEVEIAINDAGTAVLTNYRWAKLGIQLELTDQFRQIATQTANQKNNNEQPNPASSPSILVTIQNVSDESVTLNNPGDNCGFHIEPADKATSKYIESENVCTNVSETKPLVLNPEETHIIEIRLQDPRWYITHTENGQSESTDLRTIMDTSTQFRIVYRGPKNPNQDSPVGLWPGNLVSQAFSVRGRID